MDKQIYKTIQEEFVSNHHGSNLWVILILILHLPILIYIRILLVPVLSSLNVYFHKNPNYISKKYHNIILYLILYIKKYKLCFDMLYICIPMIYFMTLYNTNNTNTNTNTNTNMNNIDNFRKWYLLYYI